MGAGSQAREGIQLKLGFVQGFGVKNPRVKSLGAENRDPLLWSRLGDLGSAFPVSQIPLEQHFFPVWHSLCDSRLFSNPFSPECFSLRTEGAANSLNPGGASRSSAGFLLDGSSQALPSISWNFSWIKNPGVSPADPAGPGRL